MSPLEDRRIQRAVKLAIDVLVASLLLVALLPLLALIALCVRLDSPGPVLYRAVRLGRNGEFQMLKFRKMRADASGPRLTASEDPRLTRVGAWLARMKLDELPQLINVIKGDMSLIGPRPEDPMFVPGFEDEFDEVLRVRPGITGLAQLAFAEERNVLDPVDPVGHYLNHILPTKLRLDALYVRNYSLSLDARIVLWTLVTVVLRRPVAVDRSTGRLTRRRPRTGFDPRRDRIEAGGLLAVNGNGHGRPAGNGHGHPAGNGNGHPAGNGRAAGGRPPDPLGDAAVALRNG